MPPDSFCCMHCNFNLQTRCKNLQPLIRFLPCRLFFATLIWFRPEADSQVASWLRSSFCSVTNPVLAFSRLDLRQTSKFLLVPVHFNWCPNLKPSSIRLCKGRIQKTVQLVSIYLAQILNMLAIPGKKAGLVPNGNYVFHFGYIHLSIYPFIHWPKYLQIHKSICNHISDGSPVFSAGRWSTAVVPKVLRGPWNRHVDCWTDLIPKTRQQLYLQLLKARIRGNIDSTSSKEQTGEWAPG